MRVVYQEITKEEYDKYKTMKPSQIEDCIKIPVEWACGYGYYGCGVVIKDGKYMLAHSIGSSCD